ncbi:hypothetical protein RA27_08330 [Ruegeria sp. ANG-R]|uniref:hypothetical protein n=1 Tax=Ruegeria sp. ANG-R TaxID=1577903 RepID=UPI00057C837A|nr:hypothetical protein [Ruegeria sp. ANG-R]KIC43277.1 hypothetical protein RA27_08330 [Ruegeria sp. ANG-R]
MTFQFGVIAAAIVAVLAGLTGLDLGGPYWLVVAFWLLSLGCVYYLLAGMSLVTIFLRALLALLPVAALAALIVAQITESTLFDDGETRALIAAVAVAAGWVVTFVTAEMRQTNQEQERRRDMIRAVLAEIDLIVDWSRPINWDEAEQDMRQNFHNDPRYSVFVAYGHQFGALKRLTGQIEILRDDQIMPVTDFFQLLDRLETMETRMSEERFSALNWERRQATIIRYLKLQEKVAPTGKKAADVLRKAPFRGWIRRLG